MSTFQLHSTGTTVCVQATGTVRIYLTRENLAFIRDMVLSKPDYVNGLIESLPDKNARKVAKAMAVTGAADEIARLKAEVEALKASKVESEVA